MTAREPGDRPDAARCAEMLRAVSTTDTPPVIPAPRAIADAPTVAATANMETPGWRTTRWRAASVPTALLALLAVVVGASLWSGGSVPGAPVSEIRTQLVRSEPTSAAVPAPPAHSAEGNLVVPRPEPVSDSGNSGSSGSSGKGGSDKGTSGKGKGRHGGDGG